MSEAEITNQLLALSGLALSGVSVFFTLFSAYIVALFFFLHQAPLPMKISVFFFLTLSFAYLAVFATDMSHHAMGLHRALVDLGSRTNLTPSGKALLTDDLNLQLRWMNVAGLASLYAALLYLTFFYRWNRS